MNYDSPEVIDAARRYVAAIERTEETGKARHDEKRQLAHDDLMHALLQLNPEMNPNDFDDRQAAAELAYKIVRWYGR
ncbi:MAG: hypothetical protein B6D41_00115 [Chloroflexi bacterium UTCFX4]|jgi:hypothetical protein|nr:MAG: hypothetical protein B6D41_00115 [Chloroflexi bacterium UTCFX4]